jgi:hypothetical protein
MVFVLVPVGLSTDPTSKLKGETLADGPILAAVAADPASSTEIVPWVAAAPAIRTK